MLIVAGYFFSIVARRRAGLDTDTDLDGVRLCLSMWQATMY